MIFQFGDCELNTQLVELHLNKELQAVEPKVFQLLQFFLENHGRVLSKDEILEHVWRGRIVSDSTLSSCVKAARRVIGDSGDAQKLIKTVRGYGFRFVGEISTATSKVESSNIPVEMPIEKKQHNVSLKLLKSFQNKNVIFGREKELNQLKLSLSSCLENQGCITLLAGIAGIGKSRVLEEISHYATEADAEVIWGRCREEAGAPAYWPWRQLLISHLKHQPLMDAAQTPELANLLPELFSSPQNSITTPVEQSPEQTRFKLFHAVANLFRSLSSAKTLVLIFDDLHRADKSSLQLLEFIVAELSSSPIMFIGTYRDSDVLEGHRFQQTIYEMSRLNNYQHINLSNLSQDAVAKYVAQEMPETDSKLALEIFKRTDGHPLYLVETTRHLQQGGSSSALPTNLKAIINQRFKDLPKESFYTLQVATVIGRYFNIGLLSSVVNSDTTTILKQLDPAMSMGQLNYIETTGDYQFSHALIRESLYDSLTSSERLSLHCNVANALEKSDSDAAQIAYHYYQAVPLGTADKAIAYLEKAAKEADKMMAYEVSVRYCKQALKIANLAFKAKLTLSLGESQMRAGDGLGAIATFIQATDIAEASSEHDIYAQAAIGLEEAYWRPGLPAHKAVKCLQKALTNDTKIDQKRKLRIMCSLIRAYMMSGGDDQSRKLQIQTEAIARDLGDDNLLARALLAGVIASHLDKAKSDYLSERLEKGFESALLAKRLGDGALYNEILSWHNIDLGTNGEIYKVEKHLLEQKELIAQQPFYHYHRELWQAVIALGRGQFKDSQQYADNAQKFSQWLPGQDSDGVYGMQMFAIKREQGQLPLLSYIVEQFVKDNSENNSWKPGLALVYAEIGKKNEAITLMNSLVANNFAELPRDSLWETCLVYLSEVCAHFSVSLHAEKLYKQLLPFKNQTTLIGSNIGSLGAADRYLGMLATIMQNWTVAETHFKQALHIDNGQNFVVFATHSQFEYAKMIALRNQGNDKEIAIGMLNESKTTAEKYGMVSLHKKSITLLKSLH